MKRRIAQTLFAFVAFVMTTPAFAQAGPPFLTDDPGTPGDNNWEINVALTAEDVHQNAGSYEAPLLDINYGVGDRIQLKYEVPYVIEKEENENARGALGNSLLGVKWRFYDDEKNSGLSISTYPQLELNNSSYARDRGLVDDGPRYLLPIEINQAFEHFDVGVEAGRWFGKTPAENFLGVVAGHQFTPALELVAELYNTWTQDEDRLSTLDFGGRYELRHSLILLFMAGHSVASTEAQWTGYLGLQFLIEHTPEN